MTVELTPKEIGTPLACAQSLPPGLRAYRRTSDFTEVSVPKGLLKAHSTKPGVWGLIHVCEGQLTYLVADDRRVSTERALTPETGPGVVEPGILHEVRPEGKVRFCVEFFSI
jgi:tellurite resistance-related uncharacterized protein